MSSQNKLKILIVDDSEINRSILADMLGDEYDILEAEDGVEAVNILEEKNQEVSVVLLDIVMPKMDGFEVLSIMNKRHWIDNVPVIMISAENSSSYIEKAYELGVTDYINRPFDAYVVRRRVINTILIYEKQKRLMGMVADQMYEKERSRSNMINILSHIVEFRNNESGLHVVHINIITELLLKALIKKTDKYGIIKKDIPIISMASSLHDIGKISVPPEILNKPGKLTDEEYEIIKTHSAIGAQMIETSPFDREDPLIKYAYEICRWHHERYDGKGYPDGLKGEEIPISAQVVSMADVYDALTSERVYKPAFTSAQAMKMIINGECGQFNPILIECLKEISDTLEDELQLNSFKARNKNETRDMIEDILGSESIGASERTLDLLNHERMKYQFYASMSEEIQYEYNETLDIMTFSEWGAKKLGLPEKVLKPFTDSRVINSLGLENVQKLQTMLRKTTPTNPVIQLTSLVNIDGKPRWHKFTCRATWSNEDKPKYLGSIGKINDVHENYIKMSLLEREASHDSLTGLLNHKHAKMIINEKLNDNPDIDFALVIIDLDNFSESNNNFGHAFGDEVLKYISEKISTSVRSDDIASRIGGDEFLIFIEHKNNANAFIERLYDTISCKYKGFDVTFSMGISVTEKNGREYDNLFHCADTALYSAKQNGRQQYRFYEDSMDKCLSTITPIESDNE